MRFNTKAISVCFHHYLHITFIVTKVLELLNKFTYKHILYILCPKALNTKIHTISKSSSLFLVLKTSFHVFSITTYYDLHSLNTKETSLYRKILKHTTYLHLHF